MDPNAAWRELHEAIVDGDTDRAEEIALGLLGWLNRGGFPPRTTGEKPMGDRWDRAVTRYVCAMALGRFSRRFACM